MPASALSAECPHGLRTESARSPQSVRDVSAMCPLYPTRPDPTRPEKNSGYVCIASLGTQRARAADDAMPGASR